VAKQQACGAGASLTGLFDQWAAKTKPRDQTVYSWRRVIGQLVAYLGHDEVAKIAKAKSLLGKMRWSRPALRRPPRATASSPLSLPFFVGPRETTSCRQTRCASRLDRENHGQEAPGVQ